MNTGRRRRASLAGDEFLSRLYQQVTERQAAQFAPGYNMAAGLDRYQAWLGEHTAEEHRRPETIQLQVSAALRADLAGASAGPTAASLTIQGSAGTGRVTWTAGRDADRAVTAIYTTHYGSLVRLAVLLVRDAATAEEVVQDSFIALHAAWSRLRDTEKALSYLRQSVVNRSRSVLRHRAVTDETAPKLAPDLPAGQDSRSLLERSAVIAALRTLPPRQREALVLKYYAGLSEAQIASAMGISRGAVKSHTARGLSSLRAVLDKHSE